MKSQIWFIEFIVAITIVALSTTIFLQYILREPAEGGYATTAMEGIRISEALMSPGIPAHWDGTNVRRVGLTDGGWRLNSSKVENLYNISDARLRVALGSESKFNISIINNSIPLVIGGKTFAGSPSSVATKSATVTRYAIYNSSIVEVRVTVWE